MSRRIHVESRGEGEPVVLLHSGGMSSRQWKRLADILATTHRVVAPDFLGSGESPPWHDADPFEPAMDVEAIAEVVGELDAPFHLVGHSYGGFVALMLARRSPGRIRSLALYDPVAFGVLHGADDAEGLDDLARAKESPIWSDRAQGGGEAWFEGFVDYWNGPGSWRALPAATRASFLRVGRKVFYEVEGIMSDRTSATAYAAIDAPALVMTGEKSPPAARRVVALLAAALPRGRQVRVEGAGHMGPLSHGAVVNETIARHIATAP